MSEVSDPASPVRATTGPGGLELLTATPAQEVPGRPTLLLVHGLGHGAWCWVPWLGEAARAGHPAVAVSLRGHGGSPRRYDAEVIEFPGMGHDLMLEQDWRAPFEAMRTWLEGLPVR